MALTPEEQKELAALESKYGAPKKKAPSLTPMEQKELEELEAKYGDNQSLGGKALDYGLRALDYAGGLTRTGVAGAAGLLSGKDAVSMDDVGKAFKGQAPSSAEYMDRLGVPEGGEIDLNPFAKGKSSYRDIGGFVGDVALDPLTYVSLGGSAAAKTGAKAINPISKGLEKGGEKLFKSGLKNVDKELLEKGKKPIADLLFQEGKAGSMKKLKGVAEGVSDKALQRREALYAAASDAGALVDMSGVVKSAEKEIQKLAANPGTRDLAEKLSLYLDRYKAEGFVDIKSASDWKTALYDSLPDSAFREGRVKGPAKNFEKVLARDFKNAIEKAADEVAPGMGKEINALNEQMGTVLSARKPMNQQIKNAETPNAVTQVDMMTLGLGGLTGGLLGGAAGTGVGAVVPYAMKQGAKIMNTTGGRTRSGLLLNKLGKSGLIDASTRRGLINSNDDNR